MRDEEAARLFHETYERLAPEFGYETREDTKAFDPESPNGKLMIAVCAHVLATERAQGYAEAKEQAAGKCVERAAMYRQKAAKRDPLDEDTLNTHDKFEFGAEVSEYAADAIRAMERP